MRRMTLFKDSYAGSSLRDFPFFFLARSSATKTRTVLFSGVEACATMMRRRVRVEVNRETVRHVLGIVGREKGEVLKT